MQVNQDVQLRPTVAVIGGGYGGVNVAKALDADAAVEIFGLTTSVPS
jgi:NADH dehydrogenase FAD-containing subunit